jgi:hypothetical protein
MKTRTASLLGLLALAILGALGAMPPETKHPILDRLTDIGPTAKRQASYLLTETIHYFQQADEVMSKDDTTEAHMDNAFKRAVNRSVEDWTERTEAIQEAYLAWARQKGQAVKAMPQDWKDYFKAIADFLNDLAETHGPKAVQWKRELNTVNKRFAKFAKNSPAAFTNYRGDAAEADTELGAAKATLDKPVAQLDDLKRHRRHLQRAKTTIKNLQGYLVEQQKRGKEIMADAALKPDTFKKGLDAVETWSNACKAKENLPAPAKQIAENWVGFGKTKLEDFRKTYGDVERASADFLRGDMFKDTSFLKGLPYDRLAPVVEEWLAKVEARIAKIEAR